MDDNKSHTYDHSDIQQNCGNSIINEFVENTNHLEWINFDRFKSVKIINKRGAFSPIYSAVWIEGPKCKFDEDAKTWLRNGPIKVILKRLSDTQNLSQGFANQLYKYRRCYQSSTLADYFGMTKDPASNYMLIMKYYEQGNLYSYLDQSLGALCWRDIVEILFNISAGLNFIHETGLVHGNLHGGNILVENEADSIDARISDTGLPLYNCLDKWVTAICNDPEPSDLSNQFDAAEEIKFSNLENITF
ncbi:2524_t:CDS:2 [Funneliformis caledonium]|uniref:2524_t:CDS:1 n=1 Tax=Funneliformis caledonium TaxID=1117310 RepID=A0A9N8YWS9_9GLOM|nr:2524_t:CDS:2 [Funneliformis caledonium]